MDDLVFRHAAIEEINRFLGYLDDDMLCRLSTALKRPPPAQRWIPAPEPPEEGTVMEQKEHKDYIERDAALKAMDNLLHHHFLVVPYSATQAAATAGYKDGVKDADIRLRSIPAADVRPVSEIEKIIESLQEQADIYNARAQELLVKEDGQVSQYTWAVSLRETYRRIIKTLDDLIS